MRSMRPLLFLAAFALALLPAARAAQTPDPTLQEALEAALSNGLDATLRILFSDRLPLAAETRERLLPMTRPLGEIIDTEIVAVQAVSKRVTRYYVAIYFSRCPLWMRVERYANGQKTFYLPLRFSTNADEILPGYVTEFFPQP